GARARRGGGSRGRQPRRGGEADGRPARSWATSLDWPAGWPARETCRRCRPSEVQGVRDVQSGWGGGLGAGAGVAGAAGGPAAGQPAPLSYGRVSHGAAVLGGRPGPASGGSWAGAASVATGQRPKGGAARRWGPSRVARVGRCG